MFGRKTSDDSRAQIEAIGRSQAMIEFAMDGTIITANRNFLHALGYSIERQEPFKGGIIVHMIKRLDRGDEWGWLP